jgi:LmbE family N-acetylglucosaminyl deacetylase
VQFAQSLTLPLQPGSRVLVLAPHPDDESLGAGGLIQQALAAQARVRVLFPTDGDNNPWPQRVLERRLFINAECRRRWGTRRRSEAVQALEKLGLQARDAEFFGLPDQGLLPRWRKQDASTLELFTRALKAWPADVVIVPSSRDQHPDHRGAYHFTMEALVHCGQRPAVFSYLIHPGLFRRIAKGPALSLTPEQQATKLEAILCHQTQVALSRGRFCSYAAPEEIFIREPLPEAAPMLQPAAPV